MSEQPVHKCPEYSLMECPLCGESGFVDYVKLKDVLFGVRGSWSISRCTDPNCQLAWINSHLPASSVAEFYHDYYTHGLAVHDEVIVNRGYGLQVAGFVLSVINRLSGLTRQRRATRYMYLEHFPPGRLLDVGCGDGGRMILFSDLGWKVEGQEIDGVAAQQAMQLSGALVYCGEIHSLDLPKGQYDAIVMNHVLEHVMEPRVLLEACANLLAPGGQLVALVPNYDSFGHRIFGRNWRGLEPPRHLFHFSKVSLKRLAESAGLEHPRVFSTTANGETFAIGSFMVAQHVSARQVDQLSFFSRLKAVAFQYLALAYWFFFRDSGEECVLQFTAPRSNSKSLCSGK